MKFEMVVTGKSPYALADRKDLSLNTGGGKGIWISPRWAMTASHCITSRASPTAAAARLPSRG